MDPEHERKQIIGVCQRCSLQTASGKQALHVQCEFTRVNEWLDDARLIHTCELAKYRCVSFLIAVLEIAFGSVTSRLPGALLHSPFCLSVLRAHLPQPRMRNGLQAVLWHWLQMADAALDQRRHSPTGQLPCITTRLNDNCQAQLC